MDDNLTAMSSVKNRRERRNQRKSLREKSLEEEEAEAKEAADAAQRKKDAESVRSRELAFARAGVRASALFFCAFVPPHATSSTTTQ